MNNKNDSRKIQAARWAADKLGLEEVKLKPVSGDASFRRYFRFNTGEHSVILLDAPRPKLPKRHKTKRLPSAGHQ